jgi:hypothetical protein
MVPDSVLLMLKVQISQYDNQLKTGGEIIPEISFISHAQSPNYIGVVNKHLLQSLR